jgi:hypothetical protein
MKTTILTLLLLTTTILTVNCSNKKEQKWKYEIHGFIKTNKGLHESIWYTDTITLNDNGSIHYNNSDGSKVTIETPFILIDHSLDSTYINR